MSLCIGIILIFYYADYLNYFKKAPYTDVVFATLSDDYNKDAIFI
jgi:hypothetical protein